LGKGMSGTARLNPGTFLSGASLPVVGDSPHSSAGWKELSTFTSHWLLLGRKAELGPLSHLEEREHEAQREVTCPRSHSRVVAE
jgi:hypothetical protein